MARRTKKEIMAGVDCIDSKTVAPNTIEYHRLDGSRVIRLHLTDIIIFNVDRSVTYDSGSWQTVTTKQRMNALGPYEIYQEKSVWYLNVNGNKYPFKDGITVNSDYTVTGEGDDPKKYSRLKKQIDGYVNGYMRELIARKIPAPSGGDCWHCLFKDDNGRSMGDLSKDQDHILSHIKEKYYVPSLVTNAAEEFGISMVAKSCLGYWMSMHDQNCSGWDDIAKSQVSKSLKRYLTRRLGMAA